MSRSMRMLGLFMSTAAVVPVDGADIAMAAAETSGWASVSSAFNAWLEDPLGEAISEAFTTLCFFLGIWVAGKAVGWRFGSSNSNVKKAKLTAGGKHVATSPTSSAKQVPTARRTLSPENRGEENQRQSAQQVQRQQQRSAHGQRQGKRPLTNETDMLAAAVRAGNAAQLPKLIDCSMSRLIEDESMQEPPHILMESLFVACLRACAAKKSFNEALELYRHIACRIDKACGSTWSLLLWSSAEAGRFELCGFFLRRLFEVGVPSSNDFVNIVRFYIHSRDQDGFADMLKMFQERGCQIDLFARNRSLSMCTSNREFGLARMIVDLIPSVPLDVIAFNTMMKGFASIQEPVKCFEMYTEMRKASIAPNEMTFGILLDCCIDDNQLEHARRVFSDLRDSGLVLNVVLYTTFIKGLVNAGELTEAMSILDEMCDSYGAKPDLVTFSTLVKAHASSGNVMECIRLLERMVKQGIQPDSVLFNTVLTGCSAKAMDPAQVCHVFTWLVKRGLQPSTATISVLIKAFSLSKSWNAALELLEQAPLKFGVWPEARVYGQLAQSCSKEGCAEEALAAYIAMVRAAAKHGACVNPSNNARLHRLCTSCGSAHRPTMIYNALVQSEGRINRDVLDALEAAA